MRLAPGIRLGAYEVVDLIGAGGMGEVYRAVDTRLDRHVALKVLPEAVASDHDRTARFQREAKVLASLNHPHIAALFGLEVHEGRHFITMELVEGETLADRIAKGPIPLDEALPIARQIAEALEGAHEQGIVHRDLKPANIKVRPDGTVKVLDFGLAKALTNDGSSISGGLLTNSPTMTSPVGVTGVGVLLGTAPYMAPEQAKGQAADKRSDSWAFGCVLFEMLTGTRAFGGDDVTETVAEILKSSPDWTLLPASTPASVVGILKDSLRKDRRDRLPDIAVARQALERTVVDHTPVVPPKQQLRQWIWPSIATVSVAVAAGVLLWSARRDDAATAPAVQFGIRLPAGEYLAPQTGRALAISADGTLVVYNVQDGNGTRWVYARRLDQMQGTRIPGADRARGFALSPDAQWLAFLDSGSIKKVRIDGGVPTTVVDDSRIVPPLHGSTWSRAGRIVVAFAGAAGLMAVSEEGGPLQALTEPAGERHTQPVAMPDGEHVLYTVHREGQSPWIGLTSIEAPSQQLLIEGSDPRYADGYLFFWRDNAVWAVGFDENVLAIQGEARPVLQGVRLGRAPVGSLSPLGGPMLLDVSATGSLVHVPGGGSAEAPRIMTWVDQNGREEPVTATERLYAIPRISPDGTRIAVHIEDANADTFVYDLRAGNLMRLTFDRAPEIRPVWAHDGRSVFFRTESGGAGIVEQAADGSGPARRLVSLPGDGSPTAVTQDGKYLLFTRVGEKTARDVWMLNRLDGTTTALVTDPGIQGSGTVSPDGRWLAYNEEPGGSIFVRPFPDVNAGRWQVAPADAKWPRWSSDGRELYYQSGRAIRAVQVISDVGSFRWSSPRVVFEGSYVGFGGPAGSRNYDVGPDGRFLVIKEGSSAGEPTEIAVTLNWVAELKRRGQTNN